MNRRKKNNIENKKFVKIIDKYTNNDLKVGFVPVIGITPYSICLAGANPIPLIIKQGVLNNSVYQTNRTVSNKNKRKHSKPHNIDIDTIKKLPDALRSPTMICKGNYTGSLLIITDLVDKNNLPVVASIQLDQRGSKNKVNSITTIFGAEHISKIITKAIKNDGIIAINIEKAEKLNTDLEKRHFQSLRLNKICFDNSIAYSLENVKYPNKNTIKKERAKMDGMDFKQDIQEAVKQATLPLYQRIDALEEKLNVIVTAIPTLVAFEAATHANKSIEETIQSMETAVELITECDRTKGETIKVCVYDADKTLFTSEDGKGRIYEDLGSFNNDNAELSKKIGEAVITFDNNGNAKIPFGVNEHGEPKGEYILSAEAVNKIDDAKLSQILDGSYVLQVLDRAFAKYEAEKEKEKDGLTQLKNSSALDKYQQTVLLDKINKGEESFMLRINIDNINDIRKEFGNDKANEVIKAVANDIRRQTSKNAETKAFHIGNGDFVCMMNDLRKAQSAEDILSMTLCKPVKVDGISITADVSTLLNVVSITKDMIHIPTEQEIVQEAFKMELDETKPVQIVDSNDIGDITNEQPEKEVRKETELVDIRNKTLLTIGNGKEAEDMISKADEMGVDYVSMSSKNLGTVLIVDRVKDKNFIDVFANDISKTNQAKADKVYENVHLEVTKIIQALDNSRNEQSHNKGGTSI